MTINFEPSTIPSLITFSTLTLIFLLVLTSTPTPGRADQAPNATCDNTCGTGEVAKWVPYPFGFTPSCPIQLDCNYSFYSSSSSSNLSSPFSSSSSSSSSFSISSTIQIGDFKIQNITPNGVLIDLPAQCNRSIHSISRLFGPNYALSWNNTLLLQNCSQSFNYSCFIPVSTIESQLDIDSCGSGGDNIACYPSQRRPDNVDVLSFKDVEFSGCKFMFSSFGAGDEPGFPVLQRMELEWWLDGKCTNGSCSKDGNCAEVMLGGGRTGFRCKCNDGFIGDGFVDGAGCWRESKCNASEYMMGKCGGTTVGDSKCNASEYIKGKCGVTTIGDSKCNASEYTKGKCGVTTIGDSKCNASEYMKGKCGGTTIEGSKNRLPLKLVIGVLVGVTSLCIPCFIFCIYRKNSNMKNGVEESAKDIEGFITNYSLPALKRYRFKDKKKMTSSFKDKLGEGGYGRVYKGKLIDGRLVAVKVLNVSKANGKEFINEVATISRTSHVNVVTLLGYCFEARKRVLIYEFMPNGSLDKFIYGRNASEPKMHLEWQKLYEIAIGVARGLEYLHRGCNTRIVHFDIKPHNILLDGDFCPKISDFGLAKPSNGKESISSLLEARGTIGYIAPELFSRHFGGVSPKSDVYSYGMMVLDMVGGRQKDYAEADDTSESTYFPQWIYKRLELGKFEVLGSISVDDMQVVEKLTLVGLWCVQTIPLNRPTISKVIEMLEGSVEALKTPPIASLSSPTRSPVNSSIRSITIEEPINHGERSNSIKYGENLP